MERLSAPVVFRITRFSSVGGVQKPSRPILSSSGRPLPSFPLSREDGEFGYSNPFRMHYLRLLVPVITAYYADWLKILHERCHSPSTGLCHPDGRRFRTWIQTMVVFTSLWPRSSWAARIPWHHPAVVSRMNCGSGLGAAVPMTLRQGLAFGAKRVRSAEKPTFRALFRRNFKPRHTTRRAGGLDSRAGTG